VVAGDGLELEVLAQADGAVPAAGAAGFVSSERAVDKISSCAMRMLLSTSANRVGVT
jgi:hypothetical protein